MAVLTGGYREKTLTHIHRREIVTQMSRFHRQMLEWSRKLETGEDRTELESLMRSTEQAAEAISGHPGVLRDGHD